MRAVAAGRPDLPNTDYDTGHATKAGEYPLADRTYGAWLRELAHQDFENATSAVQQNILAYFGPTPKAPADQEEKEADNQQKTQTALVKLRAWKPGGR